MTLPLADHARQLIDELACRRDAANRIRPVTSVEILKALGHNRHAGRTLGNTVSLLDAACTLAERPWLGRLVQFDKAKNDFTGPWKAWAPFKKYIVNEAPRSMRWQDEDLVAIKSELPKLPLSPEAWWVERQLEVNECLLSVLLVTLRQASWPQSAP